MEPPGLEVSLQYETAAGCPDVSEFQRIVTRRLGYDPFRDEASQRVLVTIDERNRSVFGHLEWRDESGQWAGDQKFPARTSDCGELVRTMALALAVQIHLLTIAAAAPPTSDVPPSTPEKPSNPAPAPAPAKRPPPAKEPPTAPLPDEPTATVPDGSPADRSGWSFGGGAGFSVGDGWSSSVAGFGRLFGLVVRRPFALEVAGEVGLPTTTRRDDGAGYSQQLILGSLALCGVLPPFNACAVGKAGVARVRGRDIDVPATQSGTLVQAGLRAAVSPRLSARTFLAARVEGLANLTRLTVTLDDLPVWTAPRFAGSVGLDFGVLFP